MTVHRRSVVLGGLGALAGLAITRTTFAAAAPRSAAPSGRSSLSFHHLHTGERLDVTYRERGQLLSDAVAEITRLLRDFRTDEIHSIDVGLLDTLTALRARLGGRGRFEVISGYRSPHTNELLRNRSSGVAKNSLHMDGRAIDVRLTGVDTKSLRDAAVALRRGGVGYYAKSDFVHVDTGRFRTW
ncbi:MAG TPA: DUF882 domain-containing protein [Gammaproteobacteria bacterium]|nr:DUF882 domain-containing protein [Gammaproteobacteria bacterium]